MKVTLVVGTVKQDMASGQVLGDWKFIVNPNDGSGAKEVNIASTSADFDLPSGDYSATVQRFDSVGATFGAMASITFTVPVPAEQGDAAATLTVSFS